MSDTSAGQLAFVKETVTGAAPTTPAFSILDFVDEDLTMTVARVRSAAVAAQRVAKQNRIAGREVGNGFRFELYKAAEVEAIIEALMGNTFATDVAKAGGLLAPTFTIERKLSATDYRRFHGFRMGSAEFTVQPEQNVMVRVTGSGFTKTTGAAAIAGSTYIQPATTGKLNALDVASIVLTGGLALTTDYESLSFTVNNQLTTRKRLGPASVRGIGAGQALVTGTLRAFVDSKALADAFIAGTMFNFDVPMLLGTSGYTPSFKNVVITEYADPNTGNGDEFMATIGFEANLDTTYGSSFGFGRSAT